MSVQLFFEWLDIYPQIPPGAMCRGAIKIETDKSQTNYKLRSIFTHVDAYLEAPKLRKITKFEQVNKVWQAKGSAS